jgi:phenylalanyl-tRNA synthetase beta chain
MMRSDLSRLGLAGSPGDPRTRAVELSNPMTEEQESLRTTLLPGLLRSSAHNIAREAAGVMLFEMGNVFTAGGAGDGTLTESEALALVAAGELPQSAHGPARRIDFHDLKGALDLAAAALGTGLVWEPADARPFASGLSAAIRIGDRVAGAAGVLAPAVAAAFDLPDGTVAAELDLRELAGAAVLAGPVSAPARYPSVRRDIALVVDERIPAASLGAVIRRAGGAILESAELFDAYRGKQIPSDTKSLAFRLVFRSGDRTLTEKEADGAVASIVAALEKDFGARLRTA